MELTIYDIIKGPIISDKAYKLNKTLNQLLLEVHLRANKPMIKKALEKLFDVKVKTLRTLIRKNKTMRAQERRFNAHPTIECKKIAYVTLAEGYSLNLFEQSTQPSATQAKQ